MMSDVKNKENVKGIIQHLASYRRSEQTRSDRVGFFIIFSSCCPWAVAISMTPLWAIERHARASVSVPISSTMMTSGMWFSTASIMTLCCMDGSGTCILLAPPIAACGIFPSPAISLLVSTITCPNSKQVLKYWGIWEREREFTLLKIRINKSTHHSFVKLIWQNMSNFSQNSGLADPRPSQIEGHRH